MQEMLNYLRSNNLISKQQHGFISKRSTDTFKNRLDRFWGNQDVKYDYTAELTGAGSRSEFYTK